MVQKTAIASVGAAGAKDSQRDRPPRETHKLAVVVVGLFVAACSNWVTLAYIHDFVPRAPLPDFLFGLVPEVRWALKIGKSIACAHTLRVVWQNFERLFLADFMVVVCTLSMLALFACHKQRHIVLRRVLFIVGCLYVMRTISMFMTQLPSGYVGNSEVCAARIESSCLQVVDLAMSTTIGGFRVCKPSFSAVT